MLRPHRLCSTLGTCDFMRVPSPAARTMTATGRGSLTRLISSVYRAGKVRGAPRNNRTVFGQRSTGTNVVYPPLTCRIPLGRHDRELTATPHSRERAGDRGQHVRPDRERERNPEAAVERRRDQMREDLASLQVGRMLLWHVRQQRAE